jgi:hypothetical protein
MSFSTSLPQTACKQFKIGTVTHGRDHPSHSFWFNGVSPARRSNERSALLAFSIDCLVRRPSLDAEEDVLGLTAEILPETDAILRPRDHRFVGETPRVHDIETMVQEIVCHPHVKMAVDVGELLDIQ